MAAARPNPSLELTRYGIQLGSNVWRPGSHVMPQRLFVYGTLAPGRPNEHVLSGVPGTWQQGSVRGHLIQEGWGAEQGYPGIVIDASGEAVAGYLLTSDALESEWGRLDQFEGSQYERVLAMVQLDTGQVVGAYVYQLRR